MSSHLDEGALALWLQDNVPGFTALMTVDKFAGGQSNPTYRVTDDLGGAYVLRRQPSGPLLPSAHAVDREYRLLAALYPTGFPVPRPIALCLEPGVIGTKFYVMELVEGRTFWDGALPDQSPSERRAIYEAMIAGLGRLHSLKPGEIGLQDFGRPGNYVERQLIRWTAQYRATQTEEIEAVEKLIDWLPRTLPAPTGRSIIHGDYRIDNLIYAPHRPDLAAVLDWELATIGDPLADFSYLAMNWVLPLDGRSGLAGLDLAAAGIPTLEAAVTLYCTATGRADAPDLHWYFAYNLFRLTAIVQGVKRRLLDGNASSATAEETAARVGPLAQAAWTQARLAGA